MRSSDHAISDVGFRIGNGDGPIRSPQSAIRNLLLLLLILPSLAAVPATRPFEAAIAAAQQRSVKIYGAGIALEHGYAAGILISVDGQILTADGLILSTNNLRVTLPDGSFHNARVLRRSEPLQAALIKIDAATPVHFKLPEKNPAQRGDWVLALNNAFKVADGVEPLSVNLGIVSAIAEIDAKRKAQDVPYDGPAIIIDAITSNPGAPGGALVTVDGTLAGMIGRIIESASTNTRMNYAVPVDRLAAFVRGEQPATRPALAQGKPLTGVRLFLLGGRKAPAYIDRIAPDSPASSAGLKKDDLVLAINGKPVRDCEEYQQAEAALSPGAEAVFTIKRKTQVLQVKLTVAKEEQR
jgi:serine protease Do